MPTNCSTDAPKLIDSGSSASIVVAVTSSPTAVGSQFVFRMPGRYIIILNLAFSVDVVPSCPASDSYIVQKVLVRQLVENQVLLATYRDRALLRPLPWPSYSVDGADVWLCSTTNACHAVLMALEGMSAQNMMMLELLLAVKMSRHAHLHLWQHSEAMLLCLNVENTNCNQQLSVHKVDLLVLELSKYLSIHGLFRIELHQYTARCIEFQPWPLPSRVQVLTEQGFKSEPEPGGLRPRPPWPTPQSNLIFATSDLTMFGYNELQLGQRKTHAVRYTDLKTWLAVQSSGSVVLYPDDGQAPNIIVEEVVCPTDSKDGNYFCVTACFVDAGWKLLRTTKVYFVHLIIDRKAGLLLGVDKWGLIITAAYIHQGVILVDSIHVVVAVTFAETGATLWTLPIVVWLSNWLCSHFLWKPPWELPWFLVTLDLDLIAEPYSFPWPPQHVQVKFEYDNAIKRPFLWSSFSLNICYSMSWVINWKPLWSYQLYDTRDSSGHYNQQWQLIFLQLMIKHINVWLACVFHLSGKAKGHFLRLGGCFSACTVPLKTVVLFGILLGDHHKLLVEGNNYLLIPVNGHRYQPGSSCVLSVLVCDGCSLSCAYLVDQSVEEYVSFDTAQGVRPKLSTTESRMPWDPGGFQLYIDLRASRFLRREECQIPTLIGLPLVWAWAQSCRNKAQQRLRSSQQAPTTATGGRRKRALGINQIIKSISSLPYLFMY